MPQRLIVLILVPTVAAVVLSGLRISGSLDEAQRYGRMEQMAELGRGITRFVQEFSAERDQAIEYIAAGRPRALVPSLEAQQRKTDALVGQVRTAASRIDGSYGAEAVRDATAVSSRLDGLRALRSLVVGTKVPAFVVLQKYTEPAQELVAVLDGISQNVADDALAESSRALGALSRAKEALSRERAVLLIGARMRRLTPQELSALTAARSEEDSELAAFRNSASLEQNQRFGDIVVGTKIDKARDLRQRVIEAASTNGGLLPTTLGTARSAKVIRSSMTDMVDQMHVVEQYLADDILTRSDENGSAARISAMTDIAVVTALLIMVLLITVVMARSLVRPLRRLQAGALEVANTRLPGLVDRLRDPEAAAGGIEVRPIEIDSTDEIGQVARAFDEVHREAVRLAADEAVLRGNINAMFVNLSRRSQSLIERQLRLIEELEQSERDEEQLANLFRLDHLATRMRRNSENLLVLGGQDQARRWNKPVPLIDVVRASLSEVEQYERVALRVQGDMSVAGPVVNDLVHLVAELVENATAFSAEHTSVTVSGQMLSGGGAMLQITDNGVGMSPEELEQANWRLANPPVIDFSAARRMGLFVVGRLAVRHGVRVELRAAQGGGLTAFVVLPDAAVVPGESGGIGSRSGLAPREVAPPGQLAALTAPAADTSPGMGGHRQDGYGTAGQPMSAPPGAPMSGGSGSHPTAGGTGSHPAVGGTGPLRSVRGVTGPQPAINDSGPIPVGRNDTGPASVPPIERRPPRGRRRAAEDPHQPGDRQPPRRPGELPVREPGANLPGRPAADPPNGLFQPRGERPRDTEAGGGYRPGHTGPQPVVPEAQPMVPEPGGTRQIPWETGPLERIGTDPAAAPSGYAAGASPAAPPSPPQDVIADPTAHPPAGRKAPARRPERSPIFDAMQSEWFQRRSGGTAAENPVRGWESPADAGFRAAEAASRPVASSRTRAGLPKRVPGKNRVPGAVGHAAENPPRPAPAPDRPLPGEAVNGQAVPGQPAQGQGRQGHGQPADVVRSRFASLQRGVHRGRTEARGSSTSGEVPSQDDGETGGTR